jgi:hypothetical protein
MQTPPQDANHEQNQSDHKTWESGIQTANATNGTPNQEDFIVCQYQPDSTTFKNVTVTKTAIKQASAFNETSAKPMTSIRAASKQGSPIIREGMAIKNVIKSGSTSAPEIMAHYPWLASNTPASEINKHVNYSINCHTCKQEWILNASIQIVVPPDCT